MKELIEKICSSVKVTNLSEVDKEIIIGSIEDNKETSIEKGNFICDFLNIERRGNRRIIAELIDEYNEQSR